MSASPQNKSERPHTAARRRTPTRARSAVLLLLAAFAAASGCAAVSNPLANGVPVRRLPPELLGESRENLQRLSLSVLKQPPPTAYRLAAGDILGIWIEGIFSEKGQPPMVRPNLPGQLPTTARSVGFSLTLGGGARGNRLGTGYVLDLPAYENDVLNAVAKTGGVPGTA